MELKRKISQKIEDWYISQNKALLIKGARQVGKTHIIRSTLSRMNVHYVEINLIDHPEAVDILKTFTSIDELIMGLSTITNQSFEESNTVIFIDEVQKYKEMVTKIKFLVENGKYKYILSGSLLGVEITNLESAPVGYLTTLEMYPLDFEEFLQITNITDQTINYLKECFDYRKEVNAVINDKMMSIFKQYLVVGGMPEVVTKFVETHNLNDVIQLHYDIINLYKLDFTQYEQVDKKLMISNIYNLVPSELLKQNKRFLVSDLKKGLHFERIQNSFLWLENAGVVVTVFNATEPKIPLLLNKKQSLFKLYLSDVGILTSIYGMDSKRRILNNDPHFNAGGIYENVVACELKSKSLKPYYYNSNRIGELDFVIELDTSIVPIEVKSGKDYTIHSALNNCISNKQYEIKEAFVFGNCNIRKKGNITYMPVYMSSFLNHKEDDGHVEIIQF